MEPPYGPRRRWLLFEGALPAAQAPAGCIIADGWWACEASSETAGGTPSVAYDAVSGPPVGHSLVGTQLTTDYPLLVITDADSTLFEEEVIDLLAEINGTGEQVAAVTSAAMRGEIDFSQSLELRVGALRGLSTDSFSRVRRRLTLTPGARELISWTHQVGAEFAVVSGGFTEVLLPLAQELGVDHLCANHLEVQAGELTGRVLGRFVDASEKVARATKWSGGRMGRVVAVGDGANDVPLLRAAGMGVAFCAKPLVREQALSVLDLPRLDAVVGLLGHVPSTRPPSDAENEAVSITWV